MNKERKRNEREKKKEKIKFYYFTKVIKLSDKIYINF